MMEGEVILITGATRGIGRGVAQEIAITGANLIVVGRSHERATELVFELYKIKGSGPIGIHLMPQRLLSFAIRCGQCHDMVITMS